MLKSALLLLITANSLTSFSSGKGAPSAKIEQKPIFQSIKDLEALLQNLRTQSQNVLKLLGENQKQQKIENPDPNKLKLWQSIIKNQMEVLEKAKFNITPKDFEPILTMIPKSQDTEKTNKAYLDLVRYIQKLLNAAVEHRDAIKAPVTTEQLKSLLDRVNTLATQTLDEDATPAPNREILDRYNKAVRSQMNVLGKSESQQTLSDFENILTIIPQSPDREAKYLFYNELSDFIAQIIAKKELFDTLDLSRRKVAESHRNVLMLLQQASQDQGGSGK